MSGAEMGDEIVSTGTKQRQGGFKPGQSGNPNGRPKGSKTKGQMLLAALIEDQGEQIIQSLVDAAISGDTTAGRALLDRLVPPRKDRPSPFDLPAISTAADAARALGGLLKAVSEGVITPGEAEAVSRLIEGYAKTLEISELESRIAALEASR